MTNQEYLDSISSDLKDEILVGIALHYDVTIAAIEKEVCHEDAEKLYEYITDMNLRLQVYNKMEGANNAY